MISYAEITNVSQVSWLMIVFKHFRKTLPNMLLFGSKLMILGYRNASALVLATFPWHTIIFVTKVSVTKVLKLTFRYQLLEV